MKGTKEIKPTGTCYLMTGEEEWLKHTFMEQLKATSGVGPEDMMNWVLLEGKEVTAGEIIAACETMPFFTEQKVVLVKEAGFVKTGKKEETEKLSKWLPSLPTYAILILEEKEIDKRNQLYKRIKDSYTIKTFDYPGEQEAMDILRKQIKERNGTIATDTLLYFIHNMPDNIQYMLKELEKLLDYTQGQPITISHIQAVCVFSLEQQVFQLIKEVANKQTGKALAIYQQLIQRKESPIGVLVLIARQYRVMLQVKYLSKNNLPDKAIASQVGMPYFAVKERMKQGTQYTFKQLESILAYCLESDIAIKTGKLEPVKCVELLIMQCIYIGEKE